jgi:hypothetical protein
LLFASCLAELEKLEQEREKKFVGRNDRRVNEELVVYPVVAIGKRSKRRGMQWVMGQ